MDAGQTQAMPVDLCVDIIVPVYRGVTETRNCLDSVLANFQSTATAIIVIDDASPEPAIENYLKHLAEVGQITLLHNETNQGFVATANRGMALNPSHDVLILNSDTQVTGDWLDRMARCAYSDPTIGTVTPFSNNATICSYPRFCQVNAIPSGWSLATLDALFREVNAGQRLEIPTGVGFCMYIRRDCLNGVGYFDVAHFGLGYGEENDFCMRALKAGWRHMLCADTFVYHVGGASFGTYQDSLKEKGMKTLLQLHPHYTQQVTDFIERDPPRPLRMAVDCARAQVSAEHARQVLAERDEEITAWQQTILTLGRDHKHTERLLVELLEETRASLEKQDKALTEAQEFVRQRESDITQLQKERDQLNGKIVGLKERIAELENCLALIYASRSWRYTRMFRRS